MAGTLFFPPTMLPSIYQSGCHMTYTESLLSKWVKTYPLCECNDLFSGGFHKGVHIENQIVIENQVDGVCQLPYMATKVYLKF